jgi:hypothetical protein
MEEQPIQWQVRLDVPSMLLGFQFPDHLIQRRDGCVDPKLFIGRRLLSQENQLAG